MAKTTKLEITIKGKPSIERIHALDAIFKYLSTQYNVAGYIDGKLRWECPGKITIVIKAVAK